MSDSKETHSVRNGVIIAVVSAAIIWLASFIPGLVSWFCVTLQRCWHWLAFSSYNVPTWAISILGILSLFSAIRLADWIYGLFRSGKKPEPEFRKYRSDEFFGPKWTWSYNLYDQVIDLKCECPRCSTTLVYSEDIDSNFFVKTRFLCETCNFKSEIFEGRREYALSKVSRQIERKIKIGSFKLAIDPNDTT